MTSITYVDTNLIVPGTNDRTVFDANALSDLAQSIKSHGLIQPITVRQIEETECFQIVAGERRFRACADILGWESIPAIVSDLTDEEAAAVMLSENVARADIDPIDEAFAYSVRMQLYGWTVADCARLGGVSTVRVQFRLKLLRLRPDIQALVRSGNLALGYAQILSDADLDTNRQLMALASLRDNSAPTPQWFRRICSDLYTNQAQGTLLEDLPILTGNPIEYPSAITAIEPPTPSTHQPATIGGTPKEIVASQISFWESAAEQWASLGKPFKKQECQSAASALQFVFNML